MISTFLVPSLLLTLFTVSLNSGDGNDVKHNVFRPTVGGWVTWVVLKRASFRLADVYRLHNCT